MKKAFAIVLVLGLFLGFSCAESAAQGGGYELGYGLWAKAVLKVANNPVTLVWKEVGSDTTPNGAKVIGGYFYADPNDFAYGSEYNAEVFVKVYIATNGWANIAFNHVTVDNVDVYSAHNYTGTVNKSGTISLAGRLAEHEYTGVSTGGPTSGIFDGTWTGSGVATTVLDSYGDPCARPTSIVMTVVNGNISGTVLVSLGYTFLVSGTVLSDGTVTAGLVEDGGEEVATFSGKLYQTTSIGNGTWQDDVGCHGTWTVVKQ